jgi:hypothetical protein
MSHQGVYEVSDDQLIIKLPTEFKNSRKVLVTIDDVIESTDEKLVLKAATDPLFLADVQAVGNDESSPSNLTINSFSFLKSRESSKRYKGSLSDVVIEERSAER